MMALLDRERLLRDLRAAADVAAPPWAGPSTFERGVLDGMYRAWRILTNALEDGEYDLHQGEGA